MEQKQQEYNELERSTVKSLWLQDLKKIKQLYGGQPSNLEHDNAGAGDFKMKNQEKMPVKPKAVQSKLVLDRKVQEKKNQVMESDSSSEWSSLTSRSAADTKKSAVKRPKAAAQK